LNPSRVYNVFLLFSVLCAVLLVFCLFGTIFDIIIDAYDSSQQNTSPSDQSGKLELQPVTTSASAGNTLTRQSTSTSALDPELPSEATVGFGPPRFLKC
jgi:hypothetical protein